MTKSLPGTDVLISALIMFIGPTTISKMDYRLGASGIKARGDYPNLRFIDPDK